MRRVIRWKIRVSQKKKEDLSPIYTTEKKGSHKKVGTDQIFLPCKPSASCFHEMDPDLLFSGLAAIGGYGPQPPPPKKKNESGPLLLFESAV